MVKHGTICGGNKSLAKKLKSGLEALGFSIADSVAGDDPNSPSWDLVVWVQNMATQLTPLNDLPAEDWILYCEEEIKSAIDASVHYYPALKSNSSAGSVLVFVVPTIGMGGACGFAASAGAAEGIRVLAKGLAKLWGKDAIRIHTLALAPTHFLEADGVELGNELMAQMSLGDPAFDHIGNPETDLAKILGMLTSDGATFLTGTTLCADGGTWLA